MDEGSIEQRILISAHTVMCGHRSWNATPDVLSAHFVRYKIAEDVETFVKTRLHYLPTDTGKAISRPLSHALHTHKPNQMIHFEFCCIAPDEDAMVYDLVLKDDLSRYVRLVPTSNSDAEIIATERLRWFTSGFQNVEATIKMHSYGRSSHHFMLAHCSWSKGTVDVVFRELMRATHAFSCEFPLPMPAWPSVLPLVQSELNNIILERLYGILRLTAFTELLQDSPLRAVTGHNVDKVKVHRIVKFVCPKL